MRASRVIGLTLCAAAAAGVGWCIAHPTRMTTAPSTRASALALASAEMAEATRLGMTVSAEGDRAVTDVANTTSTPPASAERGARPGWFQLPIALGARECVAVVAVLYGAAAQLQDAALVATDSTERVLANNAEGGGGRRVAHLQWCTWEQAALRFDARPEPIGWRPPDWPPPTVHYAVLRGAWERVGGPRALDRGTLSTWAIAELARTLPLTARDTPELDTALAPPGALMVGVVGVEEGYARLLPETRETYRALWNASARDAGVPVNPSVTVAAPPPPDVTEHAGRGRRTQPAQTPPTLSPDELAREFADGGAPPARHDPVVDVGRNEFRRVLAVVDPAALGHRCVALVWTRALPLLDARVWRFDPSHWTTVPLAAEANVARDRLCPAPGGPVLYIVPDHDQQRYVLRVYDVAGSPR